MDQEQPRLDRILLSLRLRALARRLGEPLEPVEGGEPVEA
ncbi:Hypothetical Protein RSKD131_1453 [Cereibacter sphaeroides KD131]|nr:Hypothetical Protein RSKD131_1453 [Cereibacter sphaeroides KD131]